VLTTHAGARLIGMLDRYSAREHVPTTAASN
jgi:hypothetical protein